MVRFATSVMATYSIDDGIAAWMQTAASPCAITCAITAWRGTTEAECRCAEPLYNDTNVTRRNAMRAGTIEVALVVALMVVAPWVRAQVARAGSAPVASAPGQPQRSAEELAQWRAAVPVP